MIKEFEGLTPEEQDVLNNIPVWITILIAGADDKVDKKEINEALSITALKKKRARKELLEYYNAISKKFESNLNGYLTLLPEKTDDRAKLLVENISRINPILLKLERSFAIQQTRRKEAGEALELFCKIPEIRRGRCTDECQEGRA